jgi:hypothetical protein
MLFCMCNSQVDAHNDGPSTCFSDVHATLRLRRNTLTHSLTHSLTCSQCEPPSPSCRDSSTKINSTYSNHAHPTPDSHTPRPSTLKPGPRGIRAPSVPVQNPLSRTEQEYPNIQTSRNPNPKTNPDSPQTNPNSDITKLDIPTTYPPTSTIQPSNQPTNQPTNSEPTCPARRTSKAVVAEVAAAAASPATSRAGAVRGRGGSVGGNPASKQAKRTPASNRRLCSCAAQVLGMRMREGRRRNERG